MAKKKRMGPAAVLSWFVDCVCESEANGYEVAESAATTGEPPEWYGPDGETPKFEGVDGGTAMVRMPDGSLVRVKVTRVRGNPDDRRPGEIEAAEAQRWAVAGGGDS